MKFTLSWLKEYIDFDISVVELSDKLTMLGLEVEDVVDLQGNLDEIRIGRVLSVKPHPNADKLTICEVAVGNDTRRIVCGAPNVRVGMYTAVALPGTELPSGMMVKKAVIRDEVSQGMLCSEKELGISDDHNGVIVLPDQVDMNKPFKEAINLQDTLIEVDLTPNRPDCASVIGMAREVAGFVGCKLNLPIGEELPELDGVGVPFVVEIRAPDHCPRYAARLLKNVNIEPSPWWLKKRLQDVGLRPINNIVDVTNFVMMEFGQPLHAFDYNKLSGSKIIVRRAVEGERFITLDGMERILDTEMLLICDMKKPVAIAGVMGGANSEVTDDTVDILLESAYFSPVSIRRTSRRLNLATESSYRFERGVDPEGIAKAMERAVQLMVEIAGAEVVPGGFDCRTEKNISKPVIDLRVNRTNSLLGIKLSAEEIVTFLKSIEIQAQKKDANLLVVRPPSFRVDLEREIDLIEEVARLVGFNDIPISLPKTLMSSPKKDEGGDFRRRISSCMVSLGYSEAINYSFVTKKHFDQLYLADDNPTRKAVQLLNPLSEDQNIMRTTLLPGLLENVKWNVNRQNNDIKLFEIGKVFFRSAEKSDPKTSQPIEKRVLTGVISGRRHPNSSMLHYGKTLVDELDIKGALESLLQDMRLTTVEFDLVSENNETIPEYVQKNILIRIKAGDQQLGNLGKINFQVLKSFGIKQDVFFFELSLDDLIKLDTAPKSFKALPRFPAVKRDMAVLVADQEAAGNILKAINNWDEPLMEEAEIFDIYRGKPIKTGYKSVAISLTYRSDKQTLDDKTVDQVHQKLIDIIESNFNARLRGAEED